MDRVIKNCTLLILIISLDYFTLNLTAPFVNFFIIFLVKKKLYFITLILILNIIEILNPSYLTVINQNRSIYEFRMANSEIYWLSDFLIDTYWSIRGNIKNSLISFWIICFFLYFTFFLYKYFLFFFFVILIFYVQFFLLNIYFDFFFKKKNSIEYFIDLENYNKYNLTNYQIATFYLYDYPKSLAFLIVYYWFSNKFKKDDFKKTILKSWYYRIVGVSLISIKILKFFYRLISSTLEQVDWLEKKKISWFFIFIYYANLDLKLYINEELSSFFIALRHRKIIIKQDLIYTNSPEHTILKHLLHKEYFANRGGKFVAYVAGKNHQFISQQTETSGEGATFGATLTHVKEMTVSPFHTDESIKMETKLLHAERNQYAVIGFMDNGLIRAGYVKSYMKQYLNYEQRFLAEFPLYLQKLNAGYEGVMREQYFVYQNYQQKKLAYLHELNSKNLIGKNALIFIQEENMEKYLYAISYLLKAYPAMTEEEAAHTLRKAAELLVSLNNDQKVELFADVLIEHGDILLSNRDHVVEVIKHAHYPF